MCEKNAIILKTGSTLHITTPPEEDRATAARNMHKNLAKFCCVVFEICDHGQTDVLITILLSHPGADVSDADAAAGDILGEVNFR